MGASDSISNVKLNVNVGEIRQRYNSNPFKVNGTAGLPQIEPAITTGVVESVAYNAPKANENSSYKGFYSPMYGKPNYIGQNLDILNA